MALQDLEERLDKYNSLPLQSKRTWDRLQWDQNEGSDIFVTIQESVHGLTVFYKSLSQSEETVVGGTEADETGEGKSRGPEELLAWCE